MDYNEEYRNRQPSNKKDVIPHKHDAGEKKIEKKLHFFVSTNALCFTTENDRRKRIHNPKFEISTINGILI